MDFRDLDQSLLFVLGFYAAFAVLLVLLVWMEMGVPRRWSVTGRRLLEHLQRIGRIGR